MKSPYLANLNPEQRCAAEYGGPNYADARPLLIIAGAGTGKTNTLAHRVADLIVNGIYPPHILLVTFSRRAATEMIRRVERITASALGQNAGVMTGALTWSGTFHAVGARLRIAEIMRAGAERAEITIEKVLRELAVLGFSDIGKVVRWRPEVVYEEIEDEDNPANTPAQVLQD